MNIDINKMTQTEKTFFFLSLVVLGSFILPWWGVNYQANISGLGSTSSSNSIAGYQMSSCLFGLAGAIGILYFNLEKKSNYAFWSTIVCFLYGISTYFGFLGGTKLDYSVNIGGYGGGGVDSGFKIGFYVFAVASTILLFLELQKSGYLKKVNVQIGDKENEKVPNKDLNDSIENNN